MSRATGLQIVVAVPSPAVGTRIADALLDARLCACAQTLGPIQSRYEWRGKRESTREWLLVIKTRAALFAAVESAVKAVHPYELPEIIGVPMRPASAQYLEWIALQTKPTGRKAGTARRARVR